MEIKNALLGKIEVSSIDKFDVTPAAKLEISIVAIITTEEEFDEVKQSLERILLRGKSIKVQIEEQ